MVRAQLHLRPNENENWSHSVGFWKTETYYLTNQRIIKFDKKKGILQEYELRDIQALTKTYSHSHVNTQGMGSQYIRGTLSIMLVSSGAKVLDLVDIPDPDYVADMIKASQNALTRSPSNAGKTCPNCLQLINTVSIYCPKCGKKIP